jgi:hypothetical protein
MVKEECYALARQNFGAPSVNVLLGNIYHIDAGAVG